MILFLQNLLFDVQENWKCIETGIIPKPDSYPIVQAKSKKTTMYFPEKEEVQRIRVVEI